MSTDAERLAGERVQREIWQRRCPELLAHRDRLAAAVQAVVFDPEAIEAGRGPIEITRGQLDLLRAALGEGAKG